MISQANLPNYYTKVYVDDIEGWVECKILDVSIVDNKISRAKVITPNDTIVDRMVKIVDSNTEVEPDGCVYIIPMDIAEATVTMV